MDNKKKEIYFHLGLAKTGSTYLQYKIFTKFGNIYYIQRTKYNRSLKIIKKTDFSKYLISNEMDFNFKSEVLRIARTFPEARIILVIRRNDSWLASQYRRWVKNGFSGKFEDFIDLSHDRGVFKLNDVRFWPYIAFVREQLHENMLVLLYDELRDNPHAFIRKIVDYIGADYNPDHTALNKVHKSYSDKQLLLRRKWNRYFSGNIRLSNNPFLSFLQTFFVVKPIRYALLYAAKLVPSKFVPNEELIPKDYLKRIREYYKKDWEKCVTFAKSFDKYPLKTSIDHPVFNTTKLLKASKIYMKN